MRLFSNKQKKLEMIQAIRPSSKATLKIQCLFACKGNIDESKKLYDYFAGDMPDLPDYDPVQPTWVDNTKETLNGLLSFFEEHKNGLAQGYEMIRSILTSRGVNLPALAESAEDVVETTLPPINE